MLFQCSLCIDWVSSFLMAHQHIKDYFVPSEWWLSKNRCKREQCPLPQASVGGWRKDVWLALVGDVKGIQPQELCTNYPVMESPLLFLHCHPVWEGHGGMVLKRICGERERVNGELTDTGSCGRILSVNWRRICLIDLVLAKGKTKVSWLISFHSLIRQCFNILIRHSDPSHIRNIKIERSKQLYHNNMLPLFSPLPKLGQWMWRQLTDRMTIKLACVCMCVCVFVF